MELNTQEKELTTTKLSPAASLPMTIK